MLEKAIPFRVIRCFDETVRCRAGVRWTDSTLGQVSVEEPEPESRLGSAHVCAIEQKVWSRDSDSLRHLAHLRAQG